MKPIQRAALIEGMESRGPGRRKRLKDVAIPRSTYYAWKAKYEAEGTRGLEHRNRGRRAWNALTDREEAMVLRAAHDRPELPSRLLSIHMLDEKEHSISKSTVFRILKKYNLIVARPQDQRPAGKAWRHKTTRPDEIYQCDATMFVIPGWGRYKAILVVDDFSRKLLAVLLMPDETSHSIANAVEIALENAHREGHNPRTKPKMLSDNGPGFIGEVLADYLKARGIGHIFGAPYHPQTQGKVERLNRTMKEAMCMEISCSPDELQGKLLEFQRAYNATPHSSIFNVSPNQMYAGRLKKILKRRAAIKRRTLERRRLENLGRTA
jgi:transposase InsO family protein